MVIINKQLVLFYRHFLLKNISRFLRHLNLIELDISVFTISNIRVVSNYEMSYKT